MEEGGMTSTVLHPAADTHLEPLVPRAALPDARDDRLFFAQVREDPRLELEAIRPTGEDTVAVVGSGGCTALSLLGAGAGRVFAVDLNRTQNHLVELKGLAVARLGTGEALRFLGAAPCPQNSRSDAYARLRPHLSVAARGYWDAHEDSIRRGVIAAGVSERFIATITTAVRLLVHPRSRMDRLLACRSLSEQQELYAREWDSRRWRVLFRLLVGRKTLSRAYDPGFFANLEHPSFADHFLSRVEHTLTRLPVADNYFLHQILTGRYPAHEAEGVPPYLNPVGAEEISRRLDHLMLVDGSFTAFLRQQPNASIDAFALSNICEWLTPEQVDQLFAEVVRTARPGARVCFRNFVGWTAVPERWRDVVVEDRARGEDLMRRDRSLVQRRFAICRVTTLPLARRKPRGEGTVVRDARPEDNAGLIALAAACPMRGDVELRVDRSPDFFALNRLEGDRWRVGVVDGSDGVIGCVAVARRTVYLHGRPAQTLYVGDLKVHPAHRGGAVADALSRFARETCHEIGGDDTPVLLTVLAGNRPMERRANGPRGLPCLCRFATIRSWSVPVLWRRRPIPGLRVEQGSEDDLREMAALWDRVASARQMAPVLDAAGLGRWIAGAPGLRAEDYLLARHSDGTLAGFAAFWDQSGFKQLRVTGYSRRLRWVRAAYNGAARVLGSQPLPPSGGEMRCLTAVHVCAPADEPPVLRAILVEACNRALRDSFGFVNLGLDARDPLNTAVSGLLAQPTDVNAYVTTAAGRYAGPALDDRPLHYEIALV